MNIDVKFTKVDNLKIEYLVKGKGPDFLFLHGVATSFRSHVLFIEELSRHFRVWVPSLPGSGRSSGLPRGWEFLDFVNFVREFCEFHKIKPIISGHSFGGAIALKCKSLYTDQFSSMILMAPSGIPGQKTRQAIPEYTLNRLKTIFGRGVGVSLAREDIFLNFFIQGLSLLRVYKISKYLDLSGDLRKIKDKVITMWGESDPIFTKDYRNEFLKHLKEKKVYIIRGSHGFLSKNAKEICEIIRKEV